MNKGDPLYIFANSMATSWHSAMGRFADALRRSLEPPFNAEQYRQRGIELSELIKRLEVANARKTW